MISNLKPAERLKNIKPSGIRRFFALTDKKSQTIYLSVGEPDFTPPRHVLDAYTKAALEGKTHYAPTNGIPELREELAKKAFSDYGLTYDPASEILVTTGATEAIFLALMSLVNPGDEVITTDPGFVLYAPGVRLVGGVPVFVPLLEENNFKPSLGDVTSLITKKSRVMILNFPNNPTGAVLSYDEIAALAKIAVEHDLIVISDEVYEKILYDGAKHYCLAAFPGMRERTLVVNSFSKTYAMTGMRLGYVYGPKELIAALWLVHQYVVACVDTVAQYGALAALQGPQGSISQMVREFDRRRRLVCKRINEIEGVECGVPKGAFYAFPNIKALGKTSEAFVEFLAKEANVVAVPGSAFGSRGEGYLRISYAAAYEQLVEALDRIEKAVKKLG
ncbi:MAG: pyridoxal phosphate-dependent aminotransferase [Candidatus Bathyarchaeota archaeon]|nr:pyridoxal phosphate-dependent aminotransferase [Candidatus Bathyarchaeota archaeon]